MINTFDRRLMTECESERPAVNCRSMLLGLIGVIVLCSVTPYNDLVLFNSSLVGSYLPMAIVFGMMFFVIVINAPLLRYQPRWALHSGELAVILGMLLVSCTLPGSGLMRYLPAHLVGIQFHASHDATYRELMQELDLPRWMFPGSRTNPIYDRANDPVIREYWTRAIAADDSWLARWQSVPWTSWITPAITWGILVAALYTAVLCACVIIRHQWVENERLPFPIANVYIALIESPAQGHTIAKVFRARSFWIAFSAVVCIHTINGMSKYSDSIPRIPIHFDLTAMFTEPPLSYSEWGLQMSRIYFAVVGITFFMSTRVAMSMWMFFLLTQASKMAFGSFGGELTRGMQFDQQLGALMALGVFIIWIGRRHWSMVLRHMFRSGRIGESSARYLPYGVAGWGLVAALAVVFAWLLAAGASAAGAFVLIAMLMLFFICIARIIAETGLIYAEIPVPMQQPWYLLLSGAWTQMSIRTTTRSFFLTSMFTSMFTTDLRDGLTVYATHAFRAADETIRNKREKSTPGLALTGCLFLALIVGYVTAGTSMLYVEYNHSQSLDSRQMSPLNFHAISGGVTSHFLDPTLSYRPPRSGPSETHDRAGHFVFGAGLVSALSALRLWFANWPIHPIGFIMANTGPMRAAWFSILLGWCLKVSVLKLGGSELFANAKPFVLGLIMGEAVAALVLAVGSFLLYLAGFPFHNMRLLFG